MPERQLPPTHPLAKYQRQRSAVEESTYRIMDQLAAENDMLPVHPERDAETIDRGSYSYRYGELIKAIRNLHQVEPSHLDDGWC